MITTQDDLYEAYEDGKTAWIEGFDNTPPYSDPVLNAEWLRGWDDMEDGVGQK